MTLRRAARWVAVGLLVCPLALAQVHEAGNPSATKVLDDSQIAAILLALNQVAIDGARYAQSQVHRQDVVTYTNAVIGDQETLNEETKDLLSNLRLAAHENVISDRVRDTASRNLTSLKDNFEDAYLEEEIASQQRAIDLIENQLIPSARIPELITLLKNTAPVFRVHLAHARRLQGKVETGVGGSGP